MSQELTIDYEPREAFIPFHQRHTRFAALVCHRRAGKTVACIHELIIRALRTKKNRAKFAYVGPYRQQAKEIAWEYLIEGTNGFRKGPPRISELKVTLPNDATIQLYGADNADALRGLYFDGVILDEYGDWRPSIWGEIVLPTLMDRRGWAVFIGTMKGKNHFYQTLKRAENESNWFHMELKASESGILSDEDLLTMQAEMDDEQYQQEMECNPDAAVKGTYYASLISAMEREGSIGVYPYDPTEQVHVSADLGFTDSTAFWFWQLDVSGPVLIDYYEADGKELAHYFEVLDNKGYEYADIWLPHDAKSATLQTGRSTVEQFLEHNYPCKVIPKLAVQHGIDAARLILPKVRIDREHCYGGIEALRAYRRQYQEKTQQYSNTPLHDWASNGSDAFRYFALVTDVEMAEDQTTIEQLPLLKAPAYTLDELFKENEKDDWKKHVIRL